MRSLLRIVIWVSVALLVPIIPFLLLGEGFEQKQLDWVRGGLSEAQLFGAVLSLLAADLFLPVPSTAVSTYAGASLPWAMGFSASWLGLMIGSLVGFGLTRTLGRPFAEKHARKETLDQLDTLSQKYGLIVLVVTRALPLLAEASVLIMGIARIPWSRFLIAVGLSNLVVAAAYVSLGAWFRGSPVLPITIVLSAVIPLALLAPFWKRLTADDSGQILDGQHNQNNGR